MRRLLLILSLLILPQMLYAQLYAIRDSVSNGYNFWLYLPDSYGKAPVVEEDTTALAAEPKRGLTLVDRVRASHPIAAHILHTYRPSVDDISNEAQASSAGEQHIKCQSSGKLPIVLFLHGRSLCGTNLNSVRRYGSIDALSWGRQINAVIIAPQNRGDGWRPQRLKSVVDWVCERYEVDTNRLYVLGMSMGGYGTLDFAGTYPDHVAAAMALCGGSTLKDYTGLSRVPLWIVHGTADTAVPVTASRQVVEAINKVDTLNQTIYTELKGVNHSRLARLFYTDMTYEWLFSHSLIDAERVVNRSYVIDTEVLNNAYKGVRRNSGKFKVVDKNPSVVNTPSGRVHIVKSGDTLSEIAQQYGTTVTKLCELNGISRTSTLQLKQKIKLP